MENANNTVFHEKKKSMRTIGYKWLIFALVMLFNPNIQLIDLLPDFIGFFILAKFLEKAADAAPYFEEAREAFLKLGFVNLFKFPALILVRAVRSHNTLDNDILALMTLVFAVLEIIYLIPAIKNLFDALSYLGERGNAESLIKSDSLISTDALRSFTLAFAILKSLLYTLPEFLKLTRSVEIGTTTSMLTGSRYYPWAVVASLLIGFVFGGIWLSRILRYSKRIKLEGKFYSSLESLADENSYAAYEKRVTERSRNRVFLMFILAAVSSVDLTFSDFNGINLLPAFVFGLLFTIGLMGLVKHTNSKEMRVPVLVSGFLYNTVALLKYIYTFNFLDNYGYSALLYDANAEAIKLYKTVEIFAVIEVVLYLALTLLFYILMKRYADTHLGHFNSSSSETIKSSYYKEINKKTITLSSLASLVGILTFINVFVNGSVKLIFSNPADVTFPSLIVPNLPWFSLLVTASVIAYAFYSVYYFNFIKEEMSV
ncbi:MAG: hypothetical protein IJY23_00870 [Clostridia bacterium]|nr:hypothetical protein [Clostridia bacterium]